MQIPHVILAIETSVGPCSVAILRGDEVLAEETILDFHQQSKMLIPMCESVLKKAKLSYVDLSGVASSCGPGSFTSIRVGLAAAKALAFGAGKPFYGVSTLETMAFAARGNGPILAALDAHRGEVYAGAFDAEAVPASAALATTMERLASIFSGPFLLTGNKQNEIISYFAGSRISDVVTPTAAMVGRLVHAKLNGNAKNNFLSSPVYIRPPDAKLPAQS